MLIKLTTQELIAKEGLILAALKQLKHKLQEGFYLRGAIQEVFSGDLVVWEIREGVSCRGFMFAREQETDNGESFLNIIGATCDNIHVIVDCFNDLIGYCIGKELSYVRFTGRKGWKKHLQSKGFNDKLTVYSLNVGEF